MSRFAFETNWAHATVTDRPEIETTYANLSIRVGEHRVTTVHHRNSRTTSESIFVSLYPLSEWIAGNWWFLSEESEVPGRPGFLDRHALKSGRNGYCLPDLRFKPEGESYLLEWKPYRYEHAPLEFTAGGNLRLRKEEVVDALREFVDKVEARLISAGINDTWLQKEWAGIREAQADEDQHQFCRAAAWLGLDPFDSASMNDETVERITDSLPSALMEDVLRAVGSDDLGTILQWTKAQLVTNEPGAAVDDRLRDIDLKSLAAAADSPWAIGYDLASRVRSAIAEFNDVPVPLETLFGGKLPVMPTNGAPRTVDGLAILGDGFTCRTGKKRPESLRFLVARAVFDYIRLEQSESLLTAARTTRQSEGRAFAAELLAPADALRDRLVSGWTTAEHLADVAAELQVSEWVVVHQLQNHRIADLPPEISAHTG